MKNAILFILSIVVLASCVEEDTVNRRALMEKRIQEKIDKHESILLKQCRKDILEEAQLFVDSLVLIEFTELDSVAAPTRPVRPKLDKKIVLNDSIKVAPINTQQ